MDRVLNWLEALGWPSARPDWLRRHRLAIILVLAVSSWIVLLSAIVLAMMLLG